MTFAHFLLLLPGITAIVWVQAWCPRIGYVYGFVFKIIIGTLLLIPFWFPDFLMLQGKGRTCMLADALAGLSERDLKPRGDPI